ncbi:3-hydroxyacyl-CoA dehydrogenase, C-terminal [Dillenia turbinata]|uniref:3-hydroxyacyl-CoA dehydrogenase, C-terminal n=1 Tax=Dillenia turbinata TaxID=194707 RepID=A0AAN8W675_9MAGN
MAEMKVIGVVGLAQISAVHGVDVWLHNTDAAALSTASKSISDSLHCRLSQGRLSQEATKIRIVQKCKTAVDCCRNENFYHYLAGLGYEWRTLRHAKSFIISLDTFSSGISFSKTIICSQDFSGFIVNRILMSIINEAFFALYAEVATMEDIDLGMKLGTNHHMGPLELADLIGLDVSLSIMEVLYAGLGDSKYVPCPLLVQYVDAGCLRRKMWHRGLQLQ